jgi:hypothetical protein
MAERELRSRPGSCREELQMPNWFIPPVVVPALLAILIGVYALLRAPV